jgi:hypothetical protein
MLAVYIGFSAVLDSVFRRTQFQAKYHPLKLGWYLGAKLEDLPQIFPPVQLSSSKTQMEKDVRARYMQHFEGHGMANCLTASNKSTKSLIGCGRVMFRTVVLEVDRVIERVVSNHAYITHYSFYDPVY